MADIDKDLEKQLRLTEQANKSLKGYNKLLSDTLNLRKQNKALQEEGKKIVARIQEIQKKLLNNKNSLTKKEKENLKNEKKLLDLQKKGIDYSEQELKIHENALDNVNQTKIAMLSTLSIASKLKNIYNQNADFLFSQQKSVRDTELSMGILSNQASGFRKTIYNTSTITSEIGINTKELAKLQGNYSDKVGRSVQLSEEQLENMAYLAKGTMLGVEGAADFAANMDLFNTSAKDSSKFIEGVVNSASDLGLNSNKVIDNITKNIKLLNKYTFKGGVKGLEKMSKLATRFKFEMQDITNFAENLMTPEGAVEVASKLQVLGGAWSRLGDPFELMYRSRNDISGLTKDIVEATSATARFDKTTGEITIDPMELQRLREVANATGLSFDTLANSARQAAKFTKIESTMPSIFNQEDKEYLSNLAQFDKKSGEFKVSVQTKDGTVTESVNALREITPELLKSQRAFSQTLKENAKQAMTFDETWVNFKNTIKQLFLPGFEAFTNSLQDSVGGFQTWAKESGSFEAIRDFGKWAGDLAVTLIKFASDNPITTGIGLLLGKASIWYARGVQLGLGFNTIANKFGGGSTPNLPNVSPTNKPFKNSRTMGKFGKAGKYAKFGKLAKFGGITSLLGLGIDGFSNFTDKNLDGGDALLKTLDQNKYMASGAAIGALFGGVGAVPGAIIGSIADLISQSGDSKDSGLFGDYGNNSNTTNQVFNDFVSRPGENPISFSSKDTLIGAKTGGPIDKMLDKSMSNDNIGGKVTVNFNKPLEINGRLELNSGDNTSEIDLNNPILLRELSKVIQMELSKAIGGGKISSNPIAMG